MKASTVLNVHNSPETKGKDFYNIDRSLTSYGLEQISRHLQVRRLGGWKRLLCTPGSQERQIPLDEITVGLLDGSVA